MSLTFESISLHVADVEKSVSFYSKFPGAEVIIHRPGQFAKFRFGGGHIQVVAVPAEEKTFHIELDAPDLQALHDELKSVGIRAGRAASKAVLRQDPVPRARSGRQHSGVRYALSEPSQNIIRKADLGCGGTEVRLVVGLGH